MIKNELVNFILISLAIILGIFGILFCCFMIAHPTLTNVPINKWDFNILFYILGVLKGLGIFIGIVLICFGLNKLAHIILGGK
jgi:hypothetical protein